MYIYVMLSSCEGALNNEAIDCERKLSMSLMYTAKMNDIYYYMLQKCRVHRSSYIGADDY